MNKRSDEAGFLSRWSKRKSDEREGQLDEVLDADGAPEVEIVEEPETDEAALEVLKERDPELAEQIAGIDIDALTYDDDFTVFMNKNVPEFLRRKALSKLWLSNPVLANLDGLNDYDEDFTDASGLIEAVQSVFDEADTDTANQDVTEQAESDESVAPDEDAEVDAAAGDADVVDPDVEDDEAEGDAGRVKSQET